MYSAYGANLSIQFTSQQTKLLEYLACFPASSMKMLELEFNNMYDYFEAMYSLIDLGIIEQVLIPDPNNEDIPEEGYRITKRWSKWIMREIRLRNEQEKIDIEKNTANLNQTHHEKVQKIRDIIAAIFTLAPIVLISAIFLIPYIPWSFIFTLDFFTSAIAFIVLCFIGILWFTLVPLVFNSPGKEPNFISAVYSSSILAVVVLFTVFSIYFSVKDIVPDENDTQLELRSIVMFADPNEIVHEHPWCSDFEVEQHHAVHLNEYDFDSLIDKYNLCDICASIWYDEIDNVIHTNDTCAKVPPEHREDLHLEDLYDILADYKHPTLCTKCY